MDHLFIEANYSKDVKLNDEALALCKKFKSIALFSSVQFLKQLPIVKKQLLSLGIKVVSSKASRASAENQILGCNTYYSNLNLPRKPRPEAFLYIGDGMFHALALVLAQRDENDFRQVIKFDPIEQKASLLDKEMCMAIFKKNRASLMKFLSAENIGVFITVKPGQQQLKKGRELMTKYAGINGNQRGKQGRSEYPSKRFYFFVGNSMNFNQLEDFNFIDVWVNTACPRIGLDDVVKTDLPIVNIEDALNAEKILSKTF